MTASARSAPSPGAVRRTGPPGPSTPGPDPVPRPVAFAAAVVLSKAEVFAACQALADADRVLLRAGAPGEASAVGDLFELLERRLAGADPAAQVGSSGASGSPSGWYSSDSEFTQ